MCSSEPAEARGRKPLHEIVGWTVRHRLLFPSSRRLNDLVALLAVDYGLGFSGNIKMILTLDVYVEVVLLF